MWTSERVWNLRKGNTMKNNRTCWSRWQHIWGRMPLRVSLNCWETPPVSIWQIAKALPEPSICLVSIWGIWVKCACMTKSGIKETLSWCWKELFLFDQSRASSEWQWGTPLSCILELLSLIYWTACSVGSRICRRCNSYPLSRTG
jgi:hypothetical protein